MKVWFCEEGSVPDNVAFDLPGKVVWYRGHPPCLVTDEPEVNEYLCLGIVQPPVASERMKRSVLEYLEEERAKGATRRRVMLTMDEIEYVIRLVGADVFGEKP
jgi:hypothetical protein